MASVSVLYIDDEIVAPHLELLRNVCEPASKSRPHVTVRYFDTLRVPEGHFNTVVTHIDLIEAASFGLEDVEEGKNCTVYIRCKSDQLVGQEHKPHYPASEFHITIYDGKSREFARALLKVLKEFEWRFRVPLPSDTTLTKIDIKPRRPKRKPTNRTYSSLLERTFQSATSQYLSSEYLSNLSNKQRLKLVRTLCLHLHKVAADFHKIRRERNPETKKSKSAPLKIHEQEIHLTPPELAREIVEYAVRLIEPGGSQVSFGDPAVGTGTFYSALLQVLPRERIASAIGIDISSEQVDAAKWRWSRKGMKAMIGDYLHMERLPRRTLIFANPPYLRHQEIPPKYKQELRQRASANMGMRVSARSGLYVYFLLLSHAWMKPDAVAAWLIPSEFMQTAYGSVIRYYLTHNVQLVRIHQFGHDDPQFENAMVLPAVVVFRNRSPSSEQSVVLSAGGTLANPTTSEEVRVEELRHQAKWFVPGRASRKNAASNIRIGDLFIVRRGIATGANAFFVMEKATAARRGIPKSALRPVLPKARALESDVVERNSDGYPRVQPQLCLLDCHMSEDEIRTRYPRLMEYLLTAKEMGLLKRNLVRRRHPWYKQERREPAPFLCTYMGRGRAGAPPIRFIWNKSDAVVTNTYLMLYPREGLATLLRDKPGVAIKVFALLQETARETMSEKWRMHAEGLFKIEPGELLDVRLPSNPSWLIQAVASGLVRLDPAHLNRQRGMTQEILQLDTPRAAIGVLVER